ncbi:MAG: hypothetical protein ACE5D7_01680 [Fidelibacterota bacterium]
MHFTTSDSRPENPPVLLLNEADQFLCKRVNNMNTSVDVTRGRTPRQAPFLLENQVFFVTPTEIIDVDKSGHKGTLEPLLCEQNYVNGLLTLSC